MHILIWTNSVDATSRWFLDFWTINSMATISSKQIMVSKGLQIRSYLVFQAYMFGVNIVWSQPVWQVFRRKHCSTYWEISIRKESSTWIMCFTTGSSISSMIILNGLLPIFAPYQHLVVKEIPKLKTTTDQPKIQTLIQESHKESKFSTIRIGWNGSPTVLLCLRNPPKFTQPDLPSHLNPFFWNNSMVHPKGPKIDTISNDPKS